MPLLPLESSKSFNFRASNRHRLDEIAPIAKYGDSLLVPSIIG